MLTLHFAPRSRAERIVWLFEELALPYVLNEMAFHPSALKSDEHRRRHPLGRVPVLEEDGEFLFESAAIVEYVLARHASGRLRPATDSPDFRRYLQWFHYCEGMVMPPINTIVVQTILLPPERRNEEALGQARRLLGKTLDPINSALADSEYLAGKFSGADIMLGHATCMAAELGQLGDALTDLRAYNARLQERPAYQKAISYRG